MLSVYDVKHSKLSICGTALWCNYSC